MNVDLSSSHTITQAPAPLRNDALQIDQPGEVTVRLPGGRAFHGGDEVESITFDAVGSRPGLLRGVSIIFERLTTDAAFALGKKLSGEWIPDTAGNLDRWHEERLAQRAAGHEDVMTTTAVTNPDHHIGGPDGPTVDVEILYSFDPGQPGSVALRFVWPTG